MVQKMLSAAPSDEAALQIVFDAVPAAPQNAGLSSKDDLQGEPPFSWGFIEKIARPADFAKQGKTLTTAIQRTKNTRLQEFREYRDLKLSESVNSGGWGVALWASGRITEYELTGANDKRPGYEGLEEATHEVSPPYVFFQVPVPFEPKDTNERR